MSSPWSILALTPFCFHQSLTVWSRPKGRSHLVARREGDGQLHGGSACATAWSLSHTSCSACQLHNEQQRDS